MNNNRNQSSSTTGMMIKKRNCGNENGDIPEWLLVEIFLRLSSYHVCRLKLVSKEWFSIISDPCFVRAYISQSSSSSSSQRPPFTFISYYMHHKRSQYEHYLHDELYSLHDQFLRPKSTSFCILPLPHKLRGDEQNYEILGLSNGLVLYGSLSTNALNHKLYITNPITGIWILLPRTLHHANPYVYSYESIWGFDTFIAQDDGSLKSYTVVRFEGPVMGLMNFQVFFSEIGEWKNFNVHAAELPTYKEIRKQAVVFNGVMHWIVTVGYRNSRVFIIVYDPHKSPEHVRLIACPRDPEQTVREYYFHGRLSHRICGEYKGKLRYFEVYLTYNSLCDLRLRREPNFRLWILNDSDGGEVSWSMQHKIKFSDIQCDVNLTLKDIYPAGLVLPLAFHPFDSDVVYVGWNDYVLSYNFKTTKLDFYQWCRNRNPNSPLLRQWWSAFMLVIPPWPISMPRPCFEATHDEGVPTDAIQNPKFEELMTTMKPASSAEWTSCIAE